MRYAMIMAGGSGTRLWPMSRASLPKQLIPFIHGKSLLQIAVDRLSGLVSPDSIHICAGQSHRQAIAGSVTGVGTFYGEPVGRDTLNAVGLVAAEIVVRDPDAVIAVFTADHLIEPVDEFQDIVNRGFAVAETQPNALVTFGIAPTSAATGYGYLQLGESMDGAHVVEQFKEKPEAAVAEQYFAAGPDKFLWNSGMFVWRAATLMQCIKKHVPDNFAGLDELGRVWPTDQRDEALHRIYPQLPKISVDYAIMEPASKDDQFQVMAVPMPLTWLDVGSWPAFAQTCQQDDNANALGAAKHLMLDSSGNLVASNDPDHLITTIGVDNLIIIHTPDSTLVCHADRAEDIKQLYEKVGSQFSQHLL